MRLLELERRECPDFGSRDGWVVMHDLTDYIPFSDHRVSHYTAYADSDSGPVVAVGAGPGGGPRVQVRGRSDFFAFEQSFRGGVKVATDGQYIVAGAGTGGGPVVAVFTPDGQEIARWFAYDPAFRGGVSVGIRDGLVVTVPADGGGPHVREFDFHGAVLDDYWGEDPTARGPYDLVVGDVTWDGAADVSLVRGDRITINGQVVTHSAGADHVGYLGTTFAIGKDYRRARGLWGGFYDLGIVDFTDGAAGNDSPPPTTGFRPGVYTGVIPDGLPGGVIVTGAEIENLAGELVRVMQRGTGTQYAAMTDGVTDYVVTARHVAGTATNLYPIVGVGLPTIASTIGDVYSVDAVAVPSQNVSHSIRYQGRDYPIAGVRVPQAGDVMVAVGREFEFGVGRYDRFLTDPVQISWGDGTFPSIVNQLVVVPAFGPLAVPGFSGGPALLLTQTGDHYLVGMVVAGSSAFTLVTPNAAIEQALRLTAVF